MEKPRYSKIVILAKTGTFVGDTIRQAVSVAMDHQADCAFWQNGTRYMACYRKILDFVADTAWCPDAGSVDITENDASKSIGPIPNENPNLGDKEETTSEPTE